MKSNIQKKKESDVLLKEAVFTINQKLDAQTKKDIDDARQPDASSWLSAISHDQYGFSLNKAEFRDAILSRYGKELKGFRASCPYGQKYDTTQDIANSKKGGFVTTRSRTFNIDRTTIFIFSFCKELVTQLNGSALGILKHHYITKKIRELLIGNPRFLIYNSLNQLLYNYNYDIKESCLFETEFVETLDLNN